MSWANYYKARLPAQVSTQDALAAARRIVATCARPPIALDARWKVGGSDALAALAERLRAIEPAAQRVVEVELLPADPQAALAIFGRCAHEVALTVGGGEPSHAPSLSVELERAGAVGEFRVTAQLRVEGGLTRASDAVLDAVAGRLEACRARGVLPIAASGREIVARFLAAARAEGGDRALVRGVAEDGFQLVCRTWRGREPERMTVIAARPVALAAADLVPLWGEPPLYFRARLSGPDCVATAAALARLAGAYSQEDLGAFIELAVEVSGEPELGALVDVAGADPVVAKWWCGFDSWGPAYHGVRLALHGTYQDGDVGPEPGTHEVIVMVDGKRREPDAHAVAEGLAARSGYALEYARTGL